MALQSAWELARERTGGKNTRQLTNASKATLAELERVYQAKLAEVELDLPSNTFTQPLVQRTN